MVGHTYYHPWKGPNTYIYLHGRTHLLPSIEMPRVKFEYFREKLGVLHIEVPSKGK